MDRNLLYFTLVETVARLKVLCSAIVCGEHMVIGTNSIWIYQQNQPKCDLFQNATSLPMAPCANTIKCIYHNTPNTDLFP